jgi:hypothetical protein
MIEDPDSGMWVSDPNKGYIYLDNTDTLLSHFLGFTGSNNFDDNDCLTILKHLYNGMDNYVGNNTLEKLKNIFYAHLTLSDYLSDRTKHAIHLGLEKYINTLLCLFHGKDLVDYGTCLQGCWITEKGKWIVLNRQLCKDRIKEIEDNDDETLIPIGVNRGTALIDNLYPDKFPGAPDEV